MITEQDVRRIMRNIIADELPNIIRDNTNLISYGQVLDVSEDAGSVSVRPNNSSQTLSGINFINGQSDISVGDRCILISSDPNLEGNITAIII